MGRDQMQFKKRSFFFIILITTAFSSCLQNQHVQHSFHAFNVRAVLVVYIQPFFPLFLSCGLTAVCKERILMPVQVNLVDARCMWLVSGYCRLMQRLTYLSDTHPLNAEVMWALGGGCPSIISLIIPPLFPW